MTIWQVDNRIYSQSPGIFSNKTGKISEIRRSQNLPQLVSYIDGTTFANLPVINYVSSRGIFSFHSFLPVNPDMAISFDWWESLEDSLYSSSGGNFLEYIEDAKSSLGVSTSGIFVDVIFIPLDPSRLYIDSYAEISIDVVKTNWVKWSDIGSLNFDFSLSNIVGARPMEWAGLVYKIIKLKKQVVVYGENGVSLLYPHDVSFGLSNILPHGLKGRNAVAGNDSIHFFIDSLGQLFTLSDKLERLGYEEYLSELADPILSFDDTNNILYICDGILGFVYSPEMHSLGSGPINVTGIKYQDGQVYTASSSIISIPSFEMWTDIIDFSTRHGKTIHMLEVSTDLSGSLLVSIESRMDRSQNFIRLPWIETDPAGVAQYLCHGKEFRIGVRINSYQYLEIDYINIEGRIT